jgi:hypothetical protein
MIRRLRSSLVTASVFVIAASALASAQSLDVKSPAPMAAGVNKATIDSFGGDQFWYFMVQPGSFTVKFSAGSAQEGFSIGGRALMAAAFAPKTPGAVISDKETATATIWSGTVTQPTRVIVMVEPKKSALVRQTTDYFLEATGSVRFGGAAAAVSAPSVVGMYTTPGSNSSMSKLTADGGIVTTDGEKGHWELFDADSKTYVITLGGRRNSVTFQPGRGFVDNNGQLFMTLKHQ